MVCDTLCCMITVASGAEMIFEARAAARSTSGNQSLHAVIDFVRQSSKNSARSSFACAGTQPSECEMKWTHSSSAGNCLRYSRRLSAIGSAMPVAYHGAASPGAPASTGGGGTPASGGTAGGGASVGCFGVVSGTLLQSMRGAGSLVVGAASSSLPSHNATPATSASPSPTAPPAIAQFL